MAGKETMWYVKRGAVAVGAGLLSLLLLSMLFALLTVNGIVPEKWMEKCAYLCVLFSSAIFGAVSAQGTVKKLAMRLGSATAYLLLLLVLGLCFFDTLCGSRIIWIALTVALGTVLSARFERKGRGVKRKAGGEHNRKRRVKR